MERTWKNIRMRMVLALFATAVLCCSISEAAADAVQPAVSAPGQTGGAAAAAAQGEAGDVCAGKVCPHISLAICTDLAPGGVTGVCNKTTGLCDYGPIINVTDMTPCGGRGEVCWQGSCVPNRCAKRRCPTVVAKACTVRRANASNCNPLTGRCTPASGLFARKPDGTACGRGLVCWKGNCVADKCGSKFCPKLSLTPCSTIAPGGTTGRCDPITGHCETGPVVTLPDGTGCGGTGKCKSGECVQ